MKDTASHIQQRHYYRVVMKGSKRVYRFRGVWLDDGGLSILIQEGLLDYLGGGVAGPKKCQRLVKTISMTEDNTHQIDLGSTLLVGSAGEPPLQAQVLAPEAD